MFTESVILGGSLRPETRFISVKVDNDLTTIKEGRCLASRLSYIDCIPLISTLSGLFRVIVGIIHIIKHVYLAFIEKNADVNHREEITLALRNITYGIIAMIPIIGNVSVLIYNGTSRENEGTKYAKVEKGFAILYELGKEVARTSAIEYCKKLKTNPTPEELLEFMKGRTLSPQERPWGGIKVEEGAFEMQIKSAKVDRWIFSQEEEPSWIDIALLRETLSPL